MKIIVYGGLGNSDNAEVRSTLDKKHRRRKIDTVIVDDETPAALIAAEWARENGIKIKTFTADRATHGAAARVMRNIAMLNDGAELALLFPGGERMATWARAKRVPAEPIKLPPTERVLAEFKWNGKLIDRIMTPIKRTCT